LLRAAPFHARMNRSYLPPGISAVEIAAMARRRLADARAHRGAIPRTAIAAVLPAVIASHFLHRLERAGYDPYAPELTRPDTLQSWRLAAAALRNRF